MNQELELLKIRLLQLKESTTEAQLVGRINGLHWAGYTMIGLRRLDNLQYCIEQVVKNNIPGAIVEAGVWKGGAMIFATAVLQTLGADRSVYVCDAFEGLFPKPIHECDEWTEKNDFSPLSVTIEKVKENFNTFGYLTPNVCFKHGWFSDTLPSITEPISVLRIDGDTYQSTMDTLVLEPQIPSGGYIIMDDWAIESSKKAFLDYFKDRGVTEEDTIPVDTLSRYWKKP